ncbi:adenylate/guanylate cyclase domain-containing protein [Marimonas sp. MJW-29]|uniref:Adenylate/guanylate cyclase domain-containing protein n=1 Tax=Sulfitobacter sediminis TaxID=3234186 RepID=A0ABV3RM17_9RHOB
MKRQLAAVLAADICDYSRLMGEDSEAMLRALRRLRAEVFGPNIASHHGRIVKSMGDGWIVLFSSAVDAVSSAMRVQDRLAEGGHPDEPEIRMRVGVHLGDVVEEENDVFGDGVNVAARLEQAAAPGSVTVSEAVYGSLDGTLRPSFDDGGAWELKNIERPVHVWVRGETQRSIIASRTKSDGLKITVAPVATTDDRYEVQELAHAITGDVTTYLDATIWMSAIVSQSKGDAEYLLQLSLRSSGDRLRLDVQLTDAANKVWLKTKFDGSLTDIFDWQDSVSEELSGQVLRTIFDAEQSRLSSTSEAELTASDRTLQAALALELLDPQSLEKSLSYVVAALKIERDRPDALMLGLIAYGCSQSAGYSGLCARYEGHAKEWSQASQRLFDVEPRFELNRIAGPRFDGTTEPHEQRRVLEKLLRAASWDYVNLCFCGWEFVFLGLPEPALDCLHRALKLGRHSPWRLAVLGGLGIAYIQSGQFKKAIEVCNEGLAVSAGYITLYRVTAAAYAQLGERDKALAAIAEVLKQMPEDTISGVRARSGYQDTPGTRLYFEGLKMAGLPE